MAHPSLDLGLVLKAHLLLLPEVPPLLHEGAASHLSLKVVRDATRLQGNTWEKLDMVLFSKEREKKKKNSKHQKHFGFDFLFRSV